MITKIKMIDTSITYIVNFVCMCGEVLNIYFCVSILSALLPVTATLFSRKLALKLFAVILVQGQFQVPRGSLQPINHVDSHYLVGYWG